MSKPPDMSSPGWLARFILRDWLRDRRVTQQRQNSGTLNEAATAAYRDAHDAQLADAPATHHPTRPADGDNLEAMTVDQHATITRFRGELHDPRSPYRAPTGPDAGDFIKRIDE